MLFTDKKIETLRVATAKAQICISLQAMDRLKNKTTPKGDVLEIAKVAGIMAAKNTSTIIPYCHPLPLDGVQIGFTLEDSTIHIECTAKAIWKTGVEMEALTGATVAALTIYDMLKPIDKNMEIHSILLSQKKGGKSDFVETLPENFKVAVIVSSDGTHAGIRKDNSGKIICEKLKECGVEKSEYLILPDDKEQIKEALQRFTRENFHLIITTGGTGLGPRDVTVEATKEIIDREIPGVAETMRQYGQKRTPYAMLSRGLVGQKGNTLIINLPGSSAGARESMEALFPAFLHAYKMMGGGGH